jgi:hypothetical protein
VDEVFRAPVPDFRYVGLLPVPSRPVRVPATAFGLGAAVAVATSGVDARHALVAGLAAAVVSAFTLRDGRPEGRPTIAIVPWGVLVTDDAAPRVLRWAAVRRLEVEPARLSNGAASTRVRVFARNEVFEGAISGATGLDELSRHLDAYAREQCTPCALDLDGRATSESLAPSCEALLLAVEAWLRSGDAAKRLRLPASYRGGRPTIASSSAVELLRGILRGRKQSTSDVRPFAAIVAAELGAASLAPDLVALAQSPHPVVAAVARQAASRLGAPRSRAGLLDEVAPFLFSDDHARLERWSSAHLGLTSERG